MDFSKFGVRRLAVVTCVASTAFVGAAAIPATSSAAYTDCELYDTICIWPKTDYNGYADRWTGSDPNWATGNGSHVLNDDDSVDNQQNYWSRIFKDSNYNGGCRWHVGPFSKFRVVPNNDNGESHLRSVSQPSC